MSSSTLEQFVCDYVAQAGGVWDQIEPQVYDLLLPDAGEDAAGRGSAPDVLRVSFDPEALPEHPRSQLVTLGTPLVDRLLAAAIERGRGLELFRVGLNLQPYQLGTHVARSLRLLDAPKSGPGGPGEMSLVVSKVRVLAAPQLVFWFQATFTSDQREQEILPLAIDQPSGRQVRHLDALLDPAWLSDLSPATWPLWLGAGRWAAYLTARDQVARTVRALANARLRELELRLRKQETRMARYYHDLAQELAEQHTRAAARGDGEERIRQRQTLLEQERQIRVAELHKRSALSVGLRLLNLLVVEQPKLQIEAQAISAAAAPIPLRLAWDPLLENLEPVDCAECGRPTFELQRRQARLLCPACAEAQAPQRPR